VAFFSCLWLNMSNYTYEHAHQNSEIPHKQVLGVKCFDFIPQHAFLCSLRHAPNITESGIRVSEDNYQSFRLRQLLLLLLWKNLQSKHQLLMLPWRMSRLLSLTKIKLFGIIISIKFAKFWKCLYRCKTSKANGLYSTTKRLEQHTSCYLQNIENVQVKSWQH